MDTSPQSFEGWTQTVVFYKQLRERIERPEDAHSLFASVRTRTLGDVKFDRGELLKYLARTWVKAPAGPRFKLLDSKVSVDNCLGEECVKYEFIAEDHGVAHFPGSVFVMTMHGFLFLHPDSPTYVIDVGYSQRYLRGQQPFPVEGEVEPFLRSLLFTPIR